LFLYFCDSFCLLKDLTFRLASHTIFFKIFFLSCCSPPDVVEVTYCNSISVAEHVVMQILALVRNYIPSYMQVVNGGWNIADCVSRSYDVEGMDVGTVAAGRIGLAVLQRMKPFGCRLHYTDRHRLPAQVRWIVFFCYCF
jgi:lactate dehydrogenase-like 2-hydroxyacid dehydrogenase